MKFATRLKGLEALRRRLARLAGRTRQAGARPDGRST